MRTLIRKCKECDVYTLGGECPKCGSSTGMALPPRFSPEDRYGRFRRQLKMQRCENGRHND
ncbi:MAG: RNA-protein complex protein Nop10 [Thermoplasmata archaeon]|nr:RNA-protein complex protein Nop10 [Thermoplasmata archaeon]MCK4455867.1 RNA-protein complex protein Nop10 [Thermoplasmata archaeon]